MTTRPACDRCHDPLPDDAPPSLHTCRDYAHWRARAAGDTLTAAEADALMMLRVWCALDEALREGREELRADV
jgi:hypothetical protein